MKHQKSREDLLKEEYIKSLSLFLKDTSVYDCLSINNQISVVDMSLTLFDVFKIFIDSFVDEVLFWNKDIAYYDGVFTQTDLIKVTLQCYNNVILGIPNMWTMSNNVTSPIMEVEENEDLFTSPVKKTIQGKLTIKQFNQLVNDFKQISLKIWFNSYGEGLHQNCLIQANLEESLDYACNKLVSQNITRIIVMDKQSKMISGIIQQRDILSYLIKGFNQYFTLQKQEKKDHYNSESHQQHELQMEYFKNQLLNNNQTISQDTPVYDLFYKLIFNYKRNSIPIVDKDQKYLGLIDRRDFLFILKYEMFDILGQSCDYFLKMLNSEKKKYIVYYIQNREVFDFNQTIKEVVENLLMSPRGSLVCLDIDKKVRSVIQISDLFSIFLEGNQDQLTQEKII